MTNCASAVPSVKEPFEPVPEDRILSMAREAQTRVDGSVCGASMIVDCYTLASLCAEVVLHRALEAK